MKIAIRLGLILLGLLFLGQVLQGLPAPQSRLAIGAVILSSIALAVLFAKKLLSPAFGFLFAGLALAILLEENGLAEYAIRLNNAAGEPFVGIILVYGAFLALLRRDDIINVNDRNRPFAVLIGLEAWRERAKSWGKIIPNFFISLAAFVSSNIAVQAFGGNDTSISYRRRLAAVCICTTGPLVMPISSWWLFFRKDLSAEISGKTWVAFLVIGLGAGIFALGSLVHSTAIMLSEPNSPVSNRKPFNNPDSAAKERSMGLSGKPFGYYYYELYRNSLAGLFLLILGIVTYFYFIVGVPILTLTSPESILGIGVSLVIFTMAAQVMHPKGRGEAISALMKQIVSAMSGKAGFQVVLFIVIVVVFKGIVQDEIKSISGTAEAVETLSVGSSLGISVAALIFMFLLGNLLGSSFGIFAIGYLILTSVVGGFGYKIDDAIRTGAIGSLIVIAALCNQWAFSADNWHLAFGEENPANFAKKETGFFQKLDVFTPPVCNLTDEGESIGKTIYRRQAFLALLAIVVSFSSCYFYWV